MDFIGLAKTLLVVAGILILVAGILYLMGRLGWTGLPGDIHYQGQNVSVSFPIVTSIVISLILTLLLRLFSK